MDKYEFNIKVEQMRKMVARGDYVTAMKIVDTIDWKRCEMQICFPWLQQFMKKS